MKAIPRLVVILDRAGCLLPIANVAAQAIAGGADVIQIREKKLSTEELVALAEDIIDAVGDPKLVSINSNPEAAKVLSTHLHLPEQSENEVDGLALEADRLVSRSIHHPSVFEEAKDADYMILGNIFETTSKAGLAGIGTEPLALLSATTATPILAVGGIEPSNIGTVMHAGAHGVAVRSYIIGSEMPEAATRAIREEIDKWTT